MNTMTKSMPSKPPFLGPREVVAGESILPAAFVGTATVPVVIGLWHVLAEASPAVNSFLTLHVGIGPYSGKVLFGYLAGLLVAALWKLWGRRLDASPWVWFGVVLVGLATGTALVFAPVVHWLVDL